VSHSALFARLAAVVHHGGAGTVATAARAGVPQVLIPHMTDQFYWAHKLWQAGVSPKPIWRVRLTEKRLAAALAETSQYSDAARALAARLGDRTASAVAAAALS
jgi:UDP:flavonoid glycosyltransferase YjiC (YdhE family)